ncbi:hypothetical protein INR49_030973, partial [Caranx melampygus]
VLLLFPVRCWSEDETYGSLTEAQPQRCAAQDAEQKRVDDIDYGTFISLMGKRRAAQTDPHRKRNILVLKKDMKRRCWLIC